MKYEELKAALDQYEITSHEEYNVVDKLHRIINILVYGMCSQLLTLVPLKLDI